MKRPWARVGAGLAMLVVSSSAPARAQGFDRNFAPERQVRTPSLTIREPEREEPAWRRYREGQLVPPGHHVVTTHHGTLLGLGVAVLSFHYVLSVVLARADLSLTDAPAARSDSRNNALMAPLVGPFIVLGTEEGRPAAELALFALDGVAQLGGLAMTMAGISVRQRWLAPLDDSSIALRVTPGAVAVELRY